MPFPEVERVIYKNNPLDQVICQFRFSPILKIETEIPAEFQEKIRKEFPEFSETSQINIEIPPGMRNQIPSDLIGKIQPSVGHKNYGFISEDGLWKINLTRNFIALTSNSYKRWEEFRDKLYEPLTALIEIYSITNFSRVGLRYIDVIRRSKLNLDGENWTELLKPHILGILSSSEVCDKVIDFEGKYEIFLSDQKSIVRINTKSVRPMDGDELCFMIDSDFFNTTKMNIDDSKEKLDYFHMRGTRLLRWCITQRLHKSMEPQKIC